MTVNIHSVEVNLSSEHLLLIGIAVWVAVRSAGKSQDPASLGCHG
jgi:hypothetical protein